MADNAAIQAVAEAIRRTIGAVETHGPAAVELAGTYLQILAAAEILIGLVAIFVVSALAYQFFKWLWTDLKYEADREGAAIVSSIAGPIVLTTLGIIAGNTIFEVNNWISIWSPELALTAKAMSLLK